MQLNFKISENGLNVRFSNKNFDLKYPKRIWSTLSLEEKNFFLDNVAYLDTICVPLVSGFNKVKYDTSKPFFKKEVYESIINDVPSVAEESKISTKKLLDKFKRTRYVFADNKIKKPVFELDTGKRAVVPFSCGKDSLLTLAVCKEIGLNPIPMYINDTVSPSENKLKLDIIKKVAKQNKLDFEIVVNEIEKLNDFEFWDEDENQISYSHLILNFCFLGIPFLKFYNAKYLILGNEFDLNAKLVNKDGIRCYPSFDQSFEGTRRLNKIIGKATQNKVRVSSVISPLGDLAEMKILYNRYSNFGKYQSSCPCLDVSYEKRWCHNCVDDVTFFIYMKAIGNDPKIIGIRKNMFDKKYIKYHYIFNPKEKGRYEKAGGDKQLKFAYYLAYRNGAKGYAIDLFKKKFLDDIKSEENKLYKKYFKIHDSSLIPKEIRQDVISIYKEELK
jgi:hypothetical protein